MYIELLIGIAVLIIATLGSYQMVKYQRKYFEKQKELEVKEWKKEHRSALFNWFINYLEVSTQIP